MKVLLITQKADRKDPVLGFTHAWFERLAARVQSLHLLVLSKGDYAFPGNVTVTSMGKEHGAGRIARLWVFLRVMLRLVATKRVDAVFVHMCPIYAVIAAPFCKLRGIPLLMWITHGADNPTLRLAHRLADETLTASPESTALTGPRVVSTGHGIDTQKFTEKPAQTSSGQKAASVISVGRIAPSKDYSTIIEAAAILVNERDLKDFRVSIYGACYNEEDQAHFDGLKAMVEEKGVARHVFFEGSVAHDDIPEKYRNADIFISASLTGSVDKAVLEAMATGIPSITCNPSFARVFEDMSDDLLFEPGNARQLAGRLERFIAMPAGQRRDAGARLRRIVEQKHSLDPLMDRLVHEMKKAAYLKHGKSPRTQWLAQRANGRLILDIGFAGAAFPVLHFSVRQRNPESRVIGCDLFLDKILLQKFTTGVCGNAVQLPFRDEVFDCVVFAEIYEHLEQPSAALREIARVLKPGGLLIFSSPSAYAPLKWLRAWLFHPRPWDMVNVRRHLTDPTHIQFADPLSLFRLLDHLGLSVTEAVTKKHRIPLLGRITRKADTLDIPFYPFSRMGGALCLVAEKKQQ